MPELRADLAYVNHKKVYGHFQDRGRLKPRIKMLIHKRPNKAISKLVRITITMQYFLSK